MSSSFFKKAFGEQIMQTQSHVEVESKTPSEFIKIEVPMTVKFRYLWGGFPVENGHPQMVTYTKLGFQSRRTNTWIDLGRGISDLGRWSECPFAAAKRQAWNDFKASGRTDLSKMEDFKNLKDTRYMLHNVWVRENNVHPEDDGTIKIYRMKAMEKNGEPNTRAAWTYHKWHKAFWGEDAETMQEKIYDPVDGRDFILRIKGGEYVSMTESDWDMVDSAIPGIETLEDFEELRKGCYDLTEYVPECMEPDQTQAVMDEHWFVDTATSVPVAPVSAPTTTAAPKANVLEKIEDGTEAADPEPAAQTTESAVDVSGKSAKQLLEQLRQKQEAREKESAS